MSIAVDVTLTVRCDRCGATEVVTGDCYGSDPDTVDEALDLASLGIEFPDAWDGDGEDDLCPACARREEVAEATLDPIAISTVAGRYPCPTCGHAWRTTSSALECCSLLAGAAS